MSLTGFSMRGSIGRSESWVPRDRGCGGTLTPLVADGPGASGNESIRSGSAGNQKSRILPFREVTRRSASSSSAAVLKTRLIGEINEPSPLMST